MNGMGGILGITTTHTGTLDLVDISTLDENPGKNDITTDGPSSFNITYENIRRSQARYIENHLNLGNQLAKLDGLTPVYIGYLKNNLSQQEMYIFTHIVKQIHEVGYKDLKQSTGLSQGQLSSILKRLIEKKVVEQVSKGVFRIASEDKNFLPFCIMRFHPRFSSLMKRVPNGTGNPVTYIIENGISIQSPILQ